MIGQKLGHYRVEEKIGEGGMGEVYRARDEHLSRDVAIKVLPAGTLADDSARRRFRAEAEALARLNHAHIATVHDFATQDGTDFLVMEFVPGSSLADRLAGGSRPEKEVLRLGMQIAAALQEAHENRIVHRDLKPGNIRLTAKGDAKVLDFGLAKLLRPVDEINTQSLTQSQAVVGTVPYMAPEQLRAEVVDARTDIYAFGCVLYEMATGQRPFRETVSATLTDAILNRPASSPRQLTPHLSGELERVILKCLEKDQENRYQSAKELLVDLRRLTATTAVSPAVWPSGSRRWGRYAFAAGGLAALLVALLLGFNVAGLRDRLFGAPAPKIESLAVLPLDNMSGDPEQEYFADGMTEALISDLAKIRALRVISRTSVMQYKGAKKPLPQIAADRELRDILALQSDMARAIAAEVRVTLTPEEEKRLARTRAVNPEAHEAFLKGRYSLQSGTSPAKARENLERAIQLDPGYAPAHAALAEHLAFGLPAHEYMPKAREAAQKALELDDSLAEAHMSLALVKMYYDWDWAGADQEFHRALELDPGSAVVHSRYAIFCWAMKRTEEAIESSRRAQRLDPLSVIINVDLGRSYYFARQYDKAIEQFKKAMELDPHNHYPHFFMGIAYEQKGMYAEALAENIKAQELRNEPAQAETMRKGFAAGGYRGYLLAWGKYWEGEYARNRAQPVSLAFIYARAGEKDKAFHWLEKSFQERTRALVYLRSEPQLDSLRDDPRFHDLLRRMNFPER